MTYTGSLDAALFIVFLGRLLRSTCRKVFPMLHHHTAHDAAAVAAWAAAHSERIELFPLPLRAPERNPDVQLG
jgi:hypothetical protein